MNADSKNRGTNVRRDATRLASPQLSSARVDSTRLATDRIVYLVGVIIFMQRSRRINMQMLFRYKI